MRKGGQKAEATVQLVVVHVKTSDGGSPGALMFSAGKHFYGQFFKEQKARSFFSMIFKVVKICLRRR
jgi:hypothetical protein